VALNDLKSHFTSYVHYYELPQTNHLLLIYCRLFITRDVTCREVREAEYSKQIRRAAEYLESKERLKRPKMTTVTAQALQKLR